MSLKGFIVLISLIVVGIALIYQIYFTPELSAILVTESGDIQGIIQKSRNGREFYGYYGIPYAKQPVGNKRFQSPEKFGKWNGIWDGTFYRPICKQYDFIFLPGLVLGSEDCLYLNVFVPKEVEEGNLLPVMAHIHGGYFHMGGTHFQGPHYFMDHDVIVVTIAYRLGVLGFLNTGDGLVRGNMGLKDQNLGLQWIQENIRSFGGDPNRVTLFGESAGSASVHYQMLSPQSKNLFSRAIRQSGSALNNWTLMTESKQRAIAFAQRVNCPIDTTQIMVECLQNMDATTLVTGHSAMREHPTPQDPKFIPSIETIDDEEGFLTIRPLDLVKNGNFHKVPVLMGLNYDEGLIHSTALAVNASKLNFAIDNWYDWAPNAFHYGPHRRDISQKLFDFYFAPYIKNYEAQEDWIQNFTNIFGDRLFNFGISRSLEYEQAYLDQLYFYVYQHQGEFSGTILLSNSESRIHPVLNFAWKLTQALVYKNLFGWGVPLDIQGISHGDDLALFWNNFVFDAFVSPKDLQISKDLVQLFVDFASAKKSLKFGNLMIPASSKNNPTFIKLHKNPEILDGNLFKERVKIWEDLQLEN